MTLSRSARPVSAAHAGTRANFRTIAVVGGGVLGLLAAWRLAAAGARVTVLEARAQLGGLYGTTTLAGITCDRIAHEFSPDDHHVLAFFEELGLSHRLRWRPTNIAFQIDTISHPWSRLHDWRQLPGLSVTQRLRFMSTLAIAARGRDAAQLESIDATPWLQGYAGSQVFEQVLQPLLKNAFGDVLDEASAAFVQPWLARSFRTFAGKSPVSAQLEGGMEIVLHALISRLRALDVELRCNSRVGAVVSRADGVVVRTDRNHIEAFDDVVVTLTPTAAARLSAQLPTPLAARLKSVPMQSLLTAMLLLDTRLASADVIEHRDPTLPFGRVVQRSAENTEAERARTLVYLNHWHAPDSGFPAMAAQELRAAFVGGLSRLFPEFNPRSVLACRFGRLKQAMAITRPDYTRRHMPPMRSGLSGVFHLNAAQIAHGVLGLDATLALAAKRLPALIAAIAERHGPTSVEVAEPSIIGVTALVDSPLAAALESQLRMKAVRETAPPLPAVDAPASPSHTDGPAQAPVEKVVIEVPR